MSTLQEYAYLRPTALRDSLGLTPEQDCVDDVIQNSRAACEKLQAQIGAALEANAKRFNEKQGVISAVAEDQSVAEKVLFITQKVLMKGKGPVGSGSPGFVTNSVDANIAYLTGIAIAERDRICETHQPKVDAARGACLAALQKCLDESYERRKDSGWGLAWGCKWGPWWEDRKKFDCECRTACDESWAPDGAGALDAWALVLFGAVLGLLTGRPLVRRSTSAT